MNSSADVIKKLHQVVEELVTALVRESFARVLAELGRPPPAAAAPRPRRARRRPAAPAPPPPAAEPPEPERPVAEAAPEEAPRPPKPPPPSRPPTAFRAALLERWAQACPGEQFPGYWTATRKLTEMGRMPEIGAPAAPPPSPPPA
jgi:hypothetical protein